MRTPPSRPTTLAGGSTCGTRARTPVQPLPRARRAGAGAGRTLSSWPALVVLLASAAIAAACGGRQAGEPEPIAAQLGAPFVLRVGETAIVRDADFRVAFERVLEESRCPIGVECVRAGNARIAVALTREGRTQRFELNTTEGPQVVGFAGHSIELLALEPHPRRNRPPPEPDAYAATLEVRLR